MIGNRVVVGIADLKIGAPGDRLITHALGSCLGIVAHDPEAGVGGMLHVMLPSSRINAAKARETPAMFVDTGVPLLFERCYRAGARKERMIVMVAGGAGRSTDPAEDSFQIGKRNMVMLRKLLWKNGVLIRGQDVGGQRSRDMIYDVDTGTVTVRSAGTSRTL
ncbi:MAG: chemotaxis protein CheD [Gemmatimonadota bacterium]